MKAVPSIRSQLRATLALALPIVVGQVGQMLMGITDSVMIGQVGKVPLAAAAFANGVCNLALIVGLGLLLPVAVFTARAHGAREPRECAEYVRHGVALAAGLSAAMLVVMAVVWTQLGRFGQPAEVVAEVGPYFVLLTVSMVPAFFFQVFKQYSEALGHPWAPMAILLGCVGLNAGLNWMFIYGRLGAPAWGLAGAGVATLIARAVSLALLAWWLRRKPDVRAEWPGHGVGAHGAGVMGAGVEGEAAGAEGAGEGRGGGEGRGCVGPGSAPPAASMPPAASAHAATLAAGGGGNPRWLAPWSGERFREMLRIGVPAAGQWLFEAGAFSAAAFMMGWLGTAPLAAHQIALSCAGFTFMFALGLSSAVSVRLAKEAGAGRHELLRPIGFGALLVAFAIMGCFGVVFALGGGWIARGFTPEADVVELAARLLVVAAFFQVFDGGQVVGAGALRGLRDVKVPTAITFVAYWLVALPGGYVLAFHTALGATGVWVGLALGLGSAAVLLGARFHRLTRDAAGA